MWNTYRRVDLDLFAINQRIYSPLWFMDGAEKIGKMAQNVTWQNLAYI